MMYVEFDMNISFVMEFYLNGLLSDEVSIFDKSMC